MVDASGNFEEEMWAQPTLEMEQRGLGPSHATGLAEGLSREEQGIQTLWRGMALIIPRGVISVN